VNATHWVSTFLCSGCIAAGDLSPGFTSTQDKVKETFAFAIATTPVPAPGDPASRVPKHSRTGRFELSLSAAKNEKYGAWAALAKAS
jgi:hypothetical protein